MTEYHCWSLSVVEKGLVNQGQGLSCEPGQADLSWVSAVQWYQVRSPLESLGFQDVSGRNLPFFHENQKRTEKKSCLLETNAQTRSKGMG